MIIKIKDFRQNDKSASMIGAFIHQTINSGLYDGLISIDCSDIDQLESSFNRVLFGSIAANLDYSKIKERIKIIKANDFTMKNIAEIIYRVHNS